MNLQKVKSEIRTNTTKPVNSAEPENASSEGVPISVEKINVGKYGIPLIRKTESLAIAKSHSNIFDKFDPYIQNKDTLKIIKENKIPTIL